jgi:hypothetical protein
LFQRFTVVVNNMRDADVLPYDDHDRAVKLLHSLDPMCENPIRDNSVLSPKPLHLVIKR